MPRARALIAQAARWRDARLPESLLLAVALLAGIASLTGVEGPAGPIHGLVSSRFGVVRIWYSLVSLPLFQFVLGRSLFCWVLWVRVLLGLSRVPMRLLPAHADRRAGIAFLKEPTISYCSVLLLAESSVLCASWGTEAVTYGTGISQFKPLAFAVLVISIVVALGPLVVFFPKLLRARIAGLREYGGLVSQYSARFAQRWIGPQEPSDLLGTPDIQSFADIGNCYRENIEKVQVMLFGTQDAMRLAIAVVIPAVPLLLALGPGQEILLRLAKMMIGVPG
jgi:hypothetical protein